MHFWININFKDKKNGMKVFGTEVYNIFQQINNIKWSNSRNKHEFWRVARPLKDIYGMGPEPLCFEICLGSLSCWNVNYLPNPNILAELQRYLSNISQYFWEFIVPFIKWSSPVPDEEKKYNTIMLPPPCFTVGRVLLLLYAEPGSRQALLLWLLKNNWILASLDHKILSKYELSFFSISAANFLRASRWFFFS